jgi:L-alanine-DL-glutamate epimerase-like enolase superfamily enzyme
MAGIDLLTGHVHALVKERHRIVASLLHMTKPCEWDDTTPRRHSVFENPPKPADGLFHLPTGPGLGLQINEAELAKRRVPIA